MTENDKPAEERDAAVGIDQELVLEGINQLVSEIRVLETWLQELEESSEEDSDKLAARKSYDDMLRSRREMLDALNKHSEKSSPH